MGEPENIESLYKTQPRQFTVFLKQGRYQFLIWDHKTRIRKEDKILYIINCERVTPSPSFLLKQPKTLSATLKEERVRERKDNVTVFASRGGNWQLRKKNMFFFTYSCSG
jgi:hypothetical protein